MHRLRQSDNLLWHHWTLLQEKRRGGLAFIEANRDVSWTVEALTKYSLSFAEALRAYRPGERIAFQLANGAEWIAFFLALQRAGLAAVPLDGAAPRASCLETARQAQAAALYLGGEFHALAKTVRAAKACCVKVTSGSTDRPKMIPCLAEHLLADGRQVIETMGIRARDRNLAAIPLGHSYGLGNLVLPLLLQGTALVTAAEYTPRQLVEWVGAHRITVAPLVPAVLRVLATLPPGPGLAPVRTVISAGAVLPPATARAFFERYGIRIHNFYGSSETGGICYDRTGSASLAGRSVGKPLAGVSVTLRGRRILVKSAAVATRTGRWELGDSAEWNARGELVLLGRLGQGANIGGKKVHPLEVERVLRSLAGVTDAAVWLTQSHGRDLLAAGVETQLGRVDLERALAARLPAWKLPKVYVIAAELPRTSRGKLDHAALRLRLGKGV